MGDRLVTRIRAARGAVGLAVGAAALAAGGAIAAAAGTGPTTTLSTGDAFQVELPTLMGPHGIELDLSPVCEKGYSSLGADFGGSSQTTQLDHNYQGPLACTLSSDQRTVTVRAHWGHDLDLKLALTQRGKSRISHEKVAAHCEITMTKRTYLVTGALVVEIHSGVLGSYRKAPAKVTEESTDFPSCVTKLAGSSGSGSGGAVSVFDEQPSAVTTTATTTTVPTTTTATTPTSTTVTPPAAGKSDGVILGGGKPSGPVLTAAAFTEGAPFAVVDLNQSLHDLDVRGVTDTLALTLSRRNSLTFKDDLSSATADFDSSLSSGSLTYTSTGVCATNPDATSGTLSGSVTIKDPVTGSITLSASGLGNQAFLAYVDNEASSVCG